MEDALQRDFPWTVIPPVLFHCPLDPPSVLPGRGQCRRGQGRQPAPPALPTQQLPQKTADGCVVL